MIAAVLGSLGIALLVMVGATGRRMRRHPARPASRSPRLPSQSPRPAAGHPGQPGGAADARGRSPVGGFQVSSPSSHQTWPGGVSGSPAASPYSGPSEFRRPRSVGAPSPDGQGPRPTKIVGSGPAGRRGRAVALWISGAGATVGVSLLAGPGPILLLLVVFGVALLLRRVAARRAASKLRTERALAAPAVIDLLGACLLAGLNPYRSLVRVAERSPAALRVELGRAAAELDMGRTPAAALRAVGERTSLDELRAAAAALEAAERWGAPPAEALAARAEALRSRARMRAEADAGRAAVRLAFPLVFCFLPAFVLLVVVPTMAGALRLLAP
jgi:Flp pilus assembly protein TadB